MDRDREDGKAPRVLVIGQSENMTRVAAAIGTGVMIAPSSANLHDVQSVELRAAVRNIARDLADLVEDLFALRPEPLPFLLPTGTLVAFGDTIVGPAIPTPRASDAYVGIAGPREIDPKTLADRRAAAKRAKRARRQSRRKGR